MKITYKSIDKLLKSVVILMVVLSSFLFLINITSADTGDCFEGLDGVCDVNCLSVDFDCMDNPNQEGYIDDWGDLFNNGTKEELYNGENAVVDETRFFDDVENYIRGENKSEGSLNTGVKNHTTESQKETNQFYEKEVIIPEDKKLPNEYLEVEHKKIPRIYFLVGFITILLLSTILVLLYQRVKKSMMEYERHKNNLLDYIVELRSKNYSDDQIKQYFYKRGYGKTYVDKLFNEVL